MARRTTYGMTLKEKLEFYSSRSNGCIEWTGYCDRDGYGRLITNGFNWAAHRLAYTIFVGGIPVGMQVCHRCDNRKCVNPEHLFIGSNQDNINDKVAKARQQYGVRVKQAKLNPEKVLAIRGDIRTNAEIAKDYGVTQRNIELVKQKITWKQV